MFSTSDSVVHGYSVLRAVTDDLAGQSVPVGVAAWDTSIGMYAIRALEKDEKVPGVDSGTRVFLETLLRQLSRWADKGAVPYADGMLPPTTAGFWQAVSEILTTALRVDPPRAIEPFTDFRSDLEALFEAVVQPRQSAKKAQRRIDGAVRFALGHLAEEIPARVPVSAFGGAKATVLRGIVHDEGVLLVEGVNLASKNAEDDTDALVSRIMRIRAAYSDRRVATIVGYCASPGGLNGEAHLKDWIRAKVTEKVFDLARESQAFRSATEEAWTAVSSHPQLNAFRRNRLTDSDL